MSTEETTEETPKEYTEWEKKINRFNNIRNLILANDREWTEGHNQSRLDLLKEAGLLEAFLKLDAELKEHRDQLKANIEPINACLRLLSGKQAAETEGVEFEFEEHLAKVLVFEGQLFDQLEAKADEEAPTEDHIEEKNEENSEE